MAELVIPASLKRSLEETRVEYVKLGSSGLRVSNPILGAMSIGHRDWQPWVLDDEKEVSNLLKGAYRRGVNTWDTANAYSNGESERMIGNAIKTHGIPRHKLVILTKCFGIVGEEPAIWDMKYGAQMKQSKDYVNQWGLSRAAIFNAVDASLQRLQTDYIDLLQVHRFDNTVPIEETMKALHDLVQAGKVRYIGASSMWTYQFALMQACAERQNWTKFISMQNQYSLCYREEEREMNRFCQATGVGLIPWSPLYRGRLARPPGGESTARQEVLMSSPMGQVAQSDEEIIARVQEIAKKKGWKMSQVALAWVSQKGAVPIVGAGSLERLEEACAVKGKTLSEDEMQYLEEPYIPRNIMGHA